MTSTATHVDTHTHSFDLDAGIVALDFANTLEGRYDPEPQDHMREYRDLLVFSLLAGTIDQAEAGALAASADRLPEPADQQLRQTRKLREAIYGIFSAVAGGEQPRVADLDVLNAFHQRAMSRGKVVTTPEGFEWDWEPEEALDRPLWPIAKSAVDLLLTGDQRRIRECAAHDCGWLFYDTSRNQSRRWCSMQSCGNRAKVQQFRERRRGM